MSETLIQNKKIHLNYEILEEFVAGIELHGFEVKTLRRKEGSLEGARVTVRGGEAYITGMTIPPYQVANTPETYEPDRNRRLLLNKKEIMELDDTENKKGLTIVPISIFTGGPNIKLKLAIARGKKKQDKREDLKAKAQKRDMEQDMRVK